mgnify:CR=1 FL=1
MPPQMPVSPTVKALSAAEVATCASAGGFAVGAAEPSLGLDPALDLDPAVELEPEDSTINGHLGDAYWAAGRKIEAEYQWRRALTLNPDPGDAAKLEAKLNTGRPGAVLSGQ